MDSPVTNLAIREVTQEDAPQIAALLTQLGYPSSIDDVTSRLAYWKPDSLSLILIAERTGRALGCLSMHAIPYLERSRDRLLDDSGD
jgi:hypothetical protein